MDGRHNNHAESSESYHSLTDHKIVLCLLLLMCRSTHDVSLHPHPTNHKQVKANGLVVFVPRYGIEGPVFLTDNDGNALTGGGGGAAATAAAVGSDGVQQQFVLDEDKQTVVAADGSVSYSVFDKCAVRIAVVEGAARRRSIKLALVPRSELAAEDIVG